MSASPEGVEAAGPGAGDLVLSFQRSFFTMGRMDSLPLPELEERLKNSDDSTLIQHILQQTVLHPLCNKYPPSVKYRRLFLAELIKKHEMTGAEPLDDLYDALGEVLRSEELKMCHKNYFLLNTTEWLAQPFQRTFGGQPQRRHNILELGSGIGLVGITICKTCTPKQYIFSDCHPNVLQQLRTNILSNGLLLDSDTWNAKDCEVEVKNKYVSEENQGPEITVIGLDWSEVTQEQVELQPDIIIATDVIYDPEVVLCLVSVLEKFLISNERKEQGSVVYLASTVRNPETYHQFKMELDKVGIGHQVIPGPTRKIFPYNRCTEIELLKIVFAHHL
ncbi:protein-lysine N-methyltransferase EEF2KMT isoform X4 [Mustelus asterias]